MSLEHLWKRFGDVVAVRDVSLEIADGEVLVLVGPSGCGKTTVLRLIAGLETPDAGTIRIDGRRADGLSPRDRDVAMVAEAYALYPGMRVRGNLDFPLRMRGFDEPTVDRRVTDVATAMHLRSLLDRRPAGLAAGESQHVAVGRAIVRDRPAIVLLDDALSALDARQRIDARAEIARLHRDLSATVLLVTHDQAEALALGTRVAVMLDGSLEQVGTPRALYERPATVRVATFIGDPPMNLVRATVDLGGGGPSLRSGSFRLPIPAPLRAAMRDLDGETVTVGFRPDDVVVGVDPDSWDGELRGHCELVEFLGRRLLLHLRVDGFEVLAFDEAAHDVRAGYVLDALVRLDRIHVFDGRTGRAIGPSSTLVPAAT